MYMEEKNKYNTYHYQVLNVSQRFSLKTERLGIISLILES